MNKHLDILTYLYKHYLNQYGYNFASYQTKPVIKQPSDKTIECIIKLYWWCEYKKSEDLGMVYEYLYNLPIYYMMEVVNMIDMDGYLIRGYRNIKGKIKS